MTNMPLTFDVDGIDCLTDRLEIMADWRDQLAVELRRAELLQELGLLAPSHVESLSNRVTYWCEAASVLAASLRERGAQ